MQKTNGTSSEVAANASASSSAPRLSVIVPVYNSNDELTRCLDALASSSFRDFDVWVVDDGSTQPVEPIVERHGFQYLRIEGPGGPARARNRAAVRSTGDLLVFIDADVQVHPDTLERFAAAFDAHPGIDAVIGSYDDSPADPGFISQYKNIFHHYVHHASHGEVSTFWSGCGAMRRPVFIEFGGFDEDRYRIPAIEDIELGTWVSAAGHRVLLDPTVQCSHLKRWTFRGMLRADIFQRGVPWTRLMIRAGQAANTLNVKGSQRLSVVLTYLLTGFLFAGFLLPAAWVAAVAALLALLLVNRDFYRYFAEKKGWWFTLRVLPLHLLYFLYCGVCVVVGVLSHYASGDATGPPPRCPLTDRREA